MGNRVIVVGAGIVGLATAWRLQQRHPECEITVLEKEDRVAAHQTGRNSGVLHSGIYYKPGTMRAEHCRTGKEALVSFCEEEGIPFELCGKVIVAVEEEELPRLKGIHERGLANGVACTLVDQNRLAELEPHTAGIAAIHVPRAGIVSYSKVCQRLAEKIVEGGGEVRLKAEVQSIEPGTEIVVETDAETFRADFLITCAGLYSDRLARMSGDDPGVQILPFRGEYFELAPDARRFCRGLIYPVPNPEFPFLGVHFTKMVDGTVECGPNAVLGFAREGYDLRTIKWSELGEILGYRGFRRLARAHWRTGLSEFRRSISKSAFLTTLQRLIPEISSDDLLASPSGVRAMAVKPDGEMADDYIITEQERIINVCNAPSPAATSALNIGAHIAERLSKRLSTR